MRTITTELKVLVYSLVVIFFCFSCSKRKQQYSNPIFANFFNELSNESPEKFYNSYFKDKPKEYKDGYIQVLKEFKKYDYEFTITDYNSYKGDKPNLDGMTEGVYILENKNLKDPFFVKIENNKVKYLLSIGKGKEDIIGWL
ncbi:hypothetical protein [Chryseobacterium kwangjuense]|uniref:Uncharacterized protein n=1 Tax=Chryseobacterium kwangjuense TaxID=267125 RepID=A0A135W880_9FLAO|nr:hypothetical protein [Chryseobacterium kwangjuense]KXH81144.1 hypothetical protein AU378_15590 [Chryseobacterium kwangjuense]